ncbi:C-CAP/cofactor C-like domain-containing protein [Mycena indigotica]|uniref:C-CAP/cofactor C-like domain-containing protein n=1 Tax=Mycena indigotica TaxID=2126181 RepID=A0A8H6SAD0_9AGAR|nr:C-CAP/cofactor C-like domain-containing protein [Mycena indigotica]KAF7295061.1 C-CAP/cofactor C-like domain-containing protein [Mycena indigotica]
MISTQAQAAARAAYRQLFRAATATFAGDEPVLQAFRTKMRQDALVASSVTDPAAYEQHNTLAREISVILRKNIVQASRTQQSDTWTLRITEDTELGSNDSVKSAGSPNTNQPEFAFPSFRLETPVPALDKKPRMFYSAMKVAHRNRILPELREEDLEESFVRGRFSQLVKTPFFILSVIGSGPGGQSVNKTQNNVQLLHRPTGIRVTCHETRSLAINRRKARQLLLEKVSVMRETLGNADLWSLQLDQLQNPGLTKDAMAQAKQRERERRRKKKRVKRMKEDVPPKQSNDQTNTPPPPPPPPPPAPTAPATPQSVVAFDELVIDGKLKPFIALTKQLDSAPVTEIVGMLEKQLQGLRSFLLISGSCQQPDEEGLKKLLSPIQASIESITRCKDGRKDRQWEQHIIIVGDGGLAVGWIVNPKPGPYIGEIKESVQYNGNKVIKEFKEKNPKHVEWVRSFIAILDAMRSMVSASPSLARKVAPRLLRPPPPPPPAATPSASAGGTAAVFAQLNRGEEVTKGLRKVDKSEMTHKNPELRANNPIPSSVSAAAKKPLKPTKPSSLSTKKPAKFALEGKNWAIEHQENQTLTVEDGQMNQAVNLFACKNSTVQIKGKVNAVTLGKHSPPLRQVYQHLTAPIMIVDCVKTSVLVESVVASVSITNSPSFAVQITGSAPMVQVDKTDSGQIYLSKDSLGAEITTAKCSAINVSLPVEGEEIGVFQEHAVPEMLKTVVKNGKLTTMVVEHIG